MYDDHVICMLGLLSLAVYGLVWPYVVVYGLIWPLLAAIDPNSYGLVYFNSVKNICLTYLFPNLLISLLIVNQKRINNE